MNSRSLINIRLASHGFEPAAFATPLEVVTALGAMQAQDYNQALWAIASRIPNCTRQDVEGAINRCEIIRTWSMRGTIHFVPATDAKWMVDLLTPRITAKLASRRAALNTTEENLAHCANILAGALQGKTLLSRPQIFQLFEASGEHTLGQRGIHILLELAQRGLIFIGPNQGKQPTFGLLDEFVTSRALTRDESLRELAMRFFTSHAPATLKDFAYWAGLTVVDAKRAIDLAGTKLTSVDIAGATYIIGASQQFVDAPVQHSVHLMAGFDEYFLPYRNRSMIIDAEHSPHVVPGNNGMFRPMLVIDGVISGVWSRQIKGAGAVLTVYTFPGITVTHQQLASAVAAYEHFIGLPTTVTIATLHA